MSPPVVTTVDVVVAPDLETALIEGFQRLNQGDKPPGWVRSELLRGQNGAWRIQTTWRDREAVLALRQRGEAPPVLALMDRLGIAHSHAVFTVEQAEEA